MPASTYLDSCTDLQGRTWYVNDRILHRIPGVRSDAGRVIEIYSPLAAVRVRVAFDDGGVAPCYLSECTLLRRRTADEIPYAHLDGPAEHPFIPVPKQTGCAQCGYARGHHPKGGSR